MLQKTIPLSLISMLLMAASHTAIAQKKQHLRHTQQHHAAVKDTRTLEQALRQHLTQHKTVAKLPQVIKDAIQGGLDSNVANLAFHAYRNAEKEGHGQTHILSVIDYSKPSDVKRLWVLDLAHQKVLHHTYVAHGQNSGNRYATHFSNIEGSHQSSIGLFETKGAYYGSNGYSLRLEGLEQGYNDHALERAIVIHGANYVDASMIKKYGRIGRSWGCPAVETTEVTPLINDIKNGSLLFVYYPNTSWLTHSKYLA